MLALTLPVAVEWASAQGMDNGVLVGSVSHTISLAAAESPGTWQRSASGGFGIGDNNLMARPFAEYKGELYVGVSNGDGSEVRVKRGAAWEVVNTPGFGDTDNDAILAMETYGDRLYVGTFNLEYGCEVWSYDGTGWTQEVGKDAAGTPGTGNGFGHDGNRAAVSMEVHDSKLYVGTMDLHYGLIIFPPFLGVWSDGGEIWSFDGNWSKSMGGGFGDTRNIGVMALKEYNGSLYASTLCAEISVALVGTIINVTLTGKGCQLWSEGTGSWAKVSGDGFGDIDNAAVMTMDGYQGKLYMGTINGGATVGIDINTQDITGIDWHSDGLCLYSYDGTAVSNVVEGGFPGIGGMGVFSMSTMDVEGKDLLLVGAGREVEEEGGGTSLNSLLMVYDGQGWGRGAADGFGNPNNMLNMSLAVWDGKAYVGTLNTEEGCEVWCWIPPASPPPEPHSGTSTDPAMTTTFYFAEGYTGPGFQEYLCLGNPGGTQATAAITYLYKDGTTRQGEVAIPPNSRATVNVNGEAGADKEVSLMVTSQQKIVAERPMYFNYQGRWTGGHDAVGATTPSYICYFAEGYTGSGFEEWICVLNPGDSPANLTFYFQTQEEGLKTVDGLSVPPHSRGSFRANDLLGGKSYQTSLTLTSDTPIVAERPTYFDYTGTGGWHWEGGHCVMGATTLWRQYYFAEGTTRGGFEEWLTIQNPGPIEISVNATYQLGPGQGDPVPASYTVPPSSRRTVYVPDEVGSDKDVSIYLSSASPFLAERPTYFRYSYTNLTAEGGHCVIGASDPASEWFLAEGYTGSGFNQWLCLQNPGDTDATVEVTYYTQEKGPLEPKQVSVPAHSRNTLMVNEHAGPNYQLSTRVKVLSGPPVVVERPMYFIYNGWDGGHDVVGYTP